MLGRPKNRRKQAERARWRLPAHQLAHARRSSAGSARAVSPRSPPVVMWALDQPIQTVVGVGPLPARGAGGRRAGRASSSVRGAGLLSVDLAAVRRAIHTLPWVDAVSVQRAWPRGLNVLVIEQVAAARWGETGLLNTRGELFATDERHIPPELAQLSGPRGQGGGRGAALSRRAGPAHAGGPAPDGDAPRCARRLGIRSGQRRHGAPWAGARSMSASRTS